MFLNLCFFFFFMLFKFLLRYSVAIWKMYCSARSGATFLLNVTSRKRVFRTRLNACFYKRVSFSSTCFRLLCVVILFVEREEEVVRCLCRQSVSQLCFVVAFFFFFFLSLDCVGELGARWARQMGLRAAAAAAVRGTNRLRIK